MRRPEIDALGRWVIVDRFGDATTLLAVGDDEFPGVSLRRNLDRRSREVLLPALNEVLGSGIGMRRNAVLGGDAYQVDVRPVATPDGSRVPGAYGIFTLRGDPAPEPPLIGAWQWIADRDGRNVGSRSSLWDENMFALHNLTLEQVQSARGPVGEWLARLLPYEERGRAKTTVDAGLTGANGVHQLLTFGTITGPDLQHPGRKQVALVGSSIPLDEQQSAFYAYGFAREVPRPSTYRTTGFDVVDSDSFAKAYFALAGDIAYAAVDCAQSYTFMISPTWKRIGFDAQFEGDIASLASGQDHERFEQFIATARRNLDHSAASTDVQLLRADGASMPFRVRAARVDTALPESRYMLLSFEALSATR